MISHISIKKFLYFKNIELSFVKGLNVITGETGAGKSLVIDAISFALGEKGRYEEGDFVEITFENIDNEYSEEGTLIVARQVKNGRNIYYINGRRATLSTLKEATKNIVEIHSQNHQQRLMDRKYHREIIDYFAGLENLLKEYKKIYEDYIKLQQEEKNLIEQQSNRLKEIDFLKFQLEELKNANIKKGEKEELEKRYEYLSNVNFIKEHIYQSLHILEEKDGSIIFQLSTVKKLLEKVSNFDKELNHCVENLDTVFSILSDISYSLSKIDIEIDPKELDFIESRLDTINWLEKKYNTDETGLIKMIEELEKKIAFLESLEERLPEIKKQKENVYSKLIKLADEISKQRKIASTEFDKQVKDHLKDLALKEAQFVTVINEKPLDTTGKDNIIFTFSANPGFDPLPVDEASSGGEISRLSLAIKLVSGKSVECMIYDEIDAGIGGKTAVHMAGKLKSLSEKYQLILITHLPQIAAVADKHFSVEKVSDKGNTFAVVKELEDRDRKLEIARMLSGIVDDTSLELAENLIHGFE